ncbi:MAG: translation initiation factor IF-2 [Gemmatimonadota bacterium]|nr:MAG: translation initiation factor IF-2 [Gemmatimonadota bacterium]
MGKTRIHDLAAEFGIDSGQLIELLADMGIHVRSHLSAIAADQVALVRARWEREKRRGSAKEAKKTSRRRARKKATEPQVQAPAPAKRPVRRRRSAAEVAARAAAEEPPQIGVTEEAPSPAAPEKLVFQEPQPETGAPVGVPDEVAVAGETVEVGAAAGAAETVEPTTEAVDLEAEPADAEAAEPAAPEEVEAAAMQPAAEEEPEAVPGEAPAIPDIEVEPVIPRRVTRAPTPVQPPRVKPAASAGPRPVASAAPGEVAEERRRDRKRRRRGKRSQVDRIAVQANISRTLASMKGPGTKRPSRRRDEGASARELEELRRFEEREREKTTIRVNEFITVSELATTIGVPPTEIVTFCFKELSMMVTVNQRLDFDQIDLIAGEFGFKAIREEEYVPAGVMESETEEREEDLKPRPPVVTVMGHVDHGKTSLLDYVRKTNVIAGEAGGITQHIGAHHLKLPDGNAITFLDTPGHHAFTAMRARGAQVTDLVILVVAADDRVMPQTIEAISHAKNAGVPMVVAINKIDLPAADVERVKQELLQHEVLLEDFGGDTMCGAISAKSGEGVSDLLEKVVLQAELLDIKANPDRIASGTVIESTLDPGKGPVATILVKAGTLRIGDDFICGHMAGRVRAMLDERGNRVDEASPSIPVQVLGFDGVPQAGDTFSVMSEANVAREIAQRRQRLDREAEHRRASRAVSLEDLSRQIEEGEVQRLKIVIKADQGGPAEALADAFAQLSTDEVEVEVIHRGVGAISEGDVILAKASDAIIVGFHVRPDANARASAEREKVDIRTYRVIYEAVEDVKRALEGLLRPEEREIVLGEAEVREIFRISGVGTIAGCFVTHGFIKRAAKVRVIRDSVEIYDSTISSLRRFKDDVKEVKEGLECGIGVENFNDVKVGDVLEPYQIEEVARTLESVEAQKDA